MSAILQVIDAFTDRAFAGNPAAVCLLPAVRGDAWMQKVAREMNLSETAFLVRQGEGVFSLRWFTPATEVDLCGHATLASAHALFENGAVQQNGRIIFRTKSGELGCRRDGEWIEMDFPSLACEAAEIPFALAEGLGAMPSFVGRTSLNWLVEVADEKIVRELRPDFRKLAELPAMGIIVTARSASRDFDFVSRFFAPASGIDEDPVTGSAHCALGPYWSAKLNKRDLLARQVSARGGVVRVSVHGERVLLGGQAVTVSRVELLQE
jgi:PhzF family phenazine biosynthesis protein